MNSSGSSPQVSSPDDAGNGADRPLPPIPDPEVDLYSRDNDQGQRVSFHDTSVNAGHESQQEIQDESQEDEGQGESSQSETHVQGQEASSSIRTFTDSKSGGAAVPQASEELVSPPSPGAFESQLSTSTTPPISNLQPNNQLIRITTSHTEHTPETSIGDHQTITMSETWEPEWRRRSTPNSIYSTDPRPPNGRLYYEILPGTVNTPDPSEPFSPERQRMQGIEEYRLPPWQPDAEVSTCPICNSTFRESLFSSPTVDND